MWTTRFIFQMKFTNAISVIFSFVFYSCNCSVERKIFYLVQVNILENVSFKVQANEMIAIVRYSTLLSEI